jgi:hypothetical protein
LNEAFGALEPSVIVTVSVPAVDPGTRNAHETAPEELVVPEQSEVVEFQVRTYAALASSPFAVARTLLPTVPDVGLSTSWDVIVKGANVMSVDPCDTSTSWIPPGVAGTTRSTPAGTFPLPSEENVAAPTPHAAWVA